jgi:hypothetical protein
MAEVTAQSLLKTRLVAIRDVQCEGRCRHHSDEESTNATHMVFPYGRSVHRVTKLSEDLVH